MCFILDDETNEVDNNILEQQRVDTVRTYGKLLTQIKAKIQSGEYTLDKWRRVLAANRNKNQVKDKKSSKKGGEKQKLSSIVSKILNSKTGDDFILPSDESGGEDDGDNYDIYK